MRSSDRKDQPSGGKQATDKALIYSFASSSASVMYPLRSATRSLLARALLLLVVVAQQFGALAHGAMLARADPRAPMLHDVCSSAGWAREPGGSEPTEVPSTPGGTCDLCATATMAALCGEIANSATIVWVPDGAPGLSSSSSLASTAQRAYQSRAPPASFLP